MSICTIYPVSGARIQKQYQPLSTQSETHTIFVAFLKETAALISIKIFKTMHTKAAVLWERRETAGSTAAGFHNEEARQISNKNWSGEANTVKSHHKTFWGFINSWSQ